MTFEELKAEAMRQGYTLTKYYGKCRDCKWLKGLQTTIGVECLNPKKRWQTKTAKYKYPCTMACKLFEKEETRGIKH